MRRQILLVAAVTACLGCRTPCGWNPFCAGGRVPPPPTGSYGPPNTYYQPGAPAVPATVAPTGARSTAVPSNRWSTVREGQPGGALTTTSGKAAAESRSNLAQSPASSSTFNPRRGGMIASEASSSVEPGLFTPPETVAELKSDVAASAHPPSSAVKTAGASSSDTAARSKVTSATWQSRKFPVPRGATSE